MSLHSPEPFTFEADAYGHAVIRDANGMQIAWYPLGPADAARFCACLNALAGIPACDLPKVRALWDAQKFADQISHPDFPITARRSDAVPVESNPFPQLGDEP